MAAGKTKSASKAFADIHNDYSIGLKNFPANKEKH